MIQRRTCADDMSITKERKKVKTFLAFETFMWSHPSASCAAVPMAASP